jgi:aldehyde:ferredoxin oxidoreductase
LTPQSADLAIETEDRAAVMDSLILCKFLRGVFGDFFADAAEMLSLVTGWDSSSDEMIQTSKRIVDARKWFNIEAGWTPGEDTLPDRFLGSPLADDPDAFLSREQLQAAILAYNRARGWTDDGYLTPERLAELGDDLR